MTASVAVVGLVGWVLWSALRPGPELAGVQRPSYDGRGHVVGAGYSSDAPTSGPHDSRSPPCGVYSTPLDPSLAVHALEHETVVLWYDPARPEIGAELAAIVGRWDSHVIVSPSDRIDEPIVATAWNRRKGYDEVTAEVEEFVDIYRRRGPENVPCEVV